MSDRDLPIIAIDFDATIVEHQFPRIGPPVPGAFEWMKKFQDAGARLILFTMRDITHHADTLTPAVEFCRANGIEFWAVNDNPEQAKYSTSRKVYAHIYIDDCAAGVPLKASSEEGGHEFVDWEAVGPLVMKRIEEAATVARRFRTLRKVRFQRNR